MEDVNSKLVNLVAFADVDIKESVNDKAVTAWQHLARFGNRLTTVFYLVVVFCILSVMPLASFMYIASINRWATASSASPIRFYVCVLVLDILHFDAYCIYAGGQQPARPDDGEARG